MLTITSQLLHGLLITTGISAIVSYIIFKLIRKSSSQFLSLLNVYSPKSPTQAKLLGGLGISAGVVISMLSLLTREHFMTRFEESFIYSVIFSTVCITIYGYIDDKYETRARHKIIFQLFSLSFLIFYAADLLASPNHVGQAIAIATITGFLLINGTNLIDGLDTLSIKLGTITSLTFIYLGMYTGSMLCIHLSMATIAALTIFYFFNRPPAKMYMGEIGSCLIGLIYTAQAVLCYSSLKNQTYGIDAISTILIVVSLPVCELGVSFLRRIYFKTSPFSGDKLHFHYILKSKTNLSVQMTTNIYALGSLAIMMIGYSIMLTVTPFMGLLATNLLYCGIYVGFCHNEWIKNKNEKAVCIFEQMPLSAIHIIPSAQLDKIIIKITEEPSEKDQTKEAA